MGVTRLFLPLGQFSWHLFYRLVFGTGGRGECFNVICSVFKEENLFINEKYNIYKEVGSIFLVALCFL